LTPDLPRRGATPVAAIASADDQIQIRVDASKICWVARYDGSTLTACQQRNAGVHNVADAAFATQRTGRLRLLSVKCLHANEAGAKQPCEASLPAAVSPYLRDDSTGRVQGTTVRQRELDQRADLSIVSLESD
jgi:hypothetical protein